MALLSIFVTISVVASVEIFQKPHSFDVDDAHNVFFVKIDENRDRLISRSELLSFCPGCDKVFTYLLQRRSAARESSPPTDVSEFPEEGLTYPEFMWFYRESFLFENLDLDPPAAPDRLFSFPEWPGMHRSACAEVSASISPREFWLDFVKPHRAVVIRNAMPLSPAMQNWNNSEYLLSHFGALEAKLEPPLEARGDAFVRKPTRSGRATVRDIVTKNVSGYVVSVVPQSMAWDVHIPNCVLCGSRSRPYLDSPDQPPPFPFMTELEETSLWISRGRTRSQFHYDKENTMNCLITGVPKKWVILDTRRFGAGVPWVRGGGYNGTNDLFNNYTDWVGVDVDNIDLSLHSYLLSGEFEVVTQNPGDCVFLPYSILHYAGHLAESDELQVAVSYMWLPETEFVHESCHPPSRAAVPLAVFDTVWYYSGLGVVPQGLHNPRDLHSNIVRRDAGGELSFHLDELLWFLPAGVKTGDPGFELVLRLLQEGEVMVSNGIDPPLDYWLQLSAAADMNALGCNAGLEYQVRPEVEKTRMIEYLRNWVERENVSPIHTKTRKAGIDDEL